MLKAASLVLLLPMLLAAAPTAIERPVTDVPGLLSAQQTEQVASELVRLREHTGAQMAVLLVDSTDGEPIEDYATRVFQSWHGGRKGENDGLLYVLAVKDRHMRLEVGYGLEEHLPDDAVRRLLDAQGPLMRSGDYTGALTAIIQGVGERLPAVDAVPTDPLLQDKALFTVTCTALVFWLLFFLLLRPGSTRAAGRLGDGPALWGVDRRSRGRPLSPDPGRRPGSRHAREDLLGVRRDDVRVPLAAAAAECDGPGRRDDGGHPRRPCLRREPALPGLGDVHAHPLLLRRDRLPPDVHLASHLLGPQSLRLPVRRSSGVRLLAPGEAEREAEHLQLGLLGLLVERVVVFVLEFILGLIQLQLVIGLLLVQLQQRLERGRRGLRRRGLELLVVTASFSSRGLVMLKAAALVLLLPSLLAAAPTAIERPVTDVSGLLSAQQTEQVASELVRLRERTGAQMAVLIVDSTDGEPIEDYATRVFQSWHGGRKGENDGLLYVLAVKDRRMRLEVGYGLEEHLPDDAVRRLLDAQGPLMRSGDYTGALTAIIQGAAERLPELDSPPSGTITRNVPIPISRDAALVRVMGVALLLAVLVGVLRRQDLVARLGTRVTLVLAGVMFAGAWFFLSPMGQMRNLDHASLVRAFMLCFTLLCLGHILIRHEQPRLGASLMWGTLGGHVFALTQNSVGMELFFGTLIVSAVASGVILVLSFMGASGGLSPLISLFGGAAVASAWLVEDASTYSSDSGSSSWGSSSSSSSTTSWLSSSSSSDSSSSSFFSSSSDSSSSSSWSSSDSSSSSSWDSSSSSSSSDWSGGGGDSGGGGSSSSW